MQGSHFFLNQLHYKMYIKETNFIYFGEIKRHAHALEKKMLLTSDVPSLLNICKGY